jgi:hypothetical protein
MAREDSSAGENQFIFARGGKTQRRLPSARYDFAADLTLRRNRSPKVQIELPSHWIEQVTNQSDL